jgi:superfamily II DNA or RNA helicase
MHIDGGQHGVRVSLRVEIDGARDGDVPLVRAVVAAEWAGGAATAGELWAAERDGRTGEDLSAVREQVADTVRRAARVWAPMRRLRDSAVPDAIALSDAEVAQLRDDAAQWLDSLGLSVQWPGELSRGLVARTVVGARPDGRATFFSVERVLSFDWQLALGDEVLTDAEMDALAEAQRPLVRLRDQWVLVDPRVRAKARHRALESLTAIDALGVALTGSVTIDGETTTVASSGWLEAIRATIADPDGGAEPLRQPPRLAGTLRDYQLRGFRWLHRMTSLGLGACLADDMGLGKTITVLALHLHRQEDPLTAGPTLVVCPASLLGNWEREIEKFAPGCGVRRFHGPDRSLADVTDGFVLTTYATMRVDAASLRDVPWALAIADEAQHVKNPRSGTARSLRTIPAAARVALTGTPVENNLSDLWAILDWTTPGLLGTLTAFRQRWAKPIETGEDPYAADRLSRLLRPFVLRRRKADPGIAPELPPKTETDHPVALTREQVGLYEAVVRETMTEIERSSGIARRGLIVKLLTALKQICNHPAQYLKQPEGRIDGRSGKIELLDELLDTILAEDGAVLVFTQYVAMARILERHMQMRQIGAQLLHGGTPVAKRDEMVRRFNDGELPVFLLSLKAAGTGLNLTRADHVVHFDRWWNPAVEEQATDRAHRLGQTKSVQVHRLIAEGTVEDRIAAMLASKRHLADAVLRSGEVALTELSDDELGELVALRRA